MNFLFQILLNLSQVTSAVSSGSVRASSFPVKKKPEVDVFCNESFMQSLNIFQQSQNLKLFDNLPPMKFGPKFQDIQWIYLQDINLKFRAQESGNCFNEFPIKNDYF